MKKGPKNQVIKDASVPHKAFALQTGENLWATFFALSSLKPLLLQNS
jgi:hypothetical protein